ncbi:MAG TPA: arsenic resistance N-acetyltransferase ArsN2 [Paludibacter sp.]|nr:arsenic resistance N-acetyltransferase ArsN2 [Paludibacter sp.]
MLNEELKKEDYDELSKKSLVRVQYACSGNSTGIAETEYIPIVSGAASPVCYSVAGKEDAAAIEELLRVNNLPYADLDGTAIFHVAQSGGKVLGCVAVETYGGSGLLRSLAVGADSRGKGIGLQLVDIAEENARGNGLESLYLLTTTAAAFFQKLGWEIIERASVPDGIARSSEFASVCPTTAVCMFKDI